MYKDIKASCLPSKTLLELRLFGLERRGQPGVLQPQRSLSWHSEHGEKPRLCFRLLSLETGAGLGGSLKSVGSERGQFWAQHNPGWRSSSTFCGVLWGFGVSEGVPSKRGWEQVCCAQRLQLPALDTAAREPRAAEAAPAGVFCLSVCPRACTSSLPRAPGFLPQPHCGFLLPVDHGCDLVQRAGNLLRDEDPVVAVSENLQVAGALEHSYVQVSRWGRELQRQRAKTLIVKGLFC